MYKNQYIERLKTERFKEIHRIIKKKLEAKQRRYVFNYA